MNPIHKARQKAAEICATMYLIIFPPYKIWNTPLGETPEILSGRLKTATKIYGFISGKRVR